MSVTLVSCYYRFKSKHSFDDYERWIINFLKIKTKTSLFTDRESQDILLKYKRDNHQLILVEKEEWLVNKYREKYEIFHKNDHENRYHTVDLYMVWNEKSNFLLRAMNYTSSDYLLWVDIGCFRKSEVIDNYILWPRYDKFRTLAEDRILLLQVAKFEADEVDSVQSGKMPFFKLNNRISGTIFGGLRNKLLEWHQLYYSALDSYFNLDPLRYEGKDQSIMAYLRLKYPSLVRIIFREDQWFYLQDALL